MDMSFVRILLSFSIAVLFFTPLTSAEGLQIGTIERPPFVMESSNGELIGFSIDLWKAVALKLDLDYEFNEYSVFSEMIDETESEKNDLSIANISITSEREKRMDFSNPIFDSGLALMIAKDSGEYTSFLSYLFNGPTIVTILILLLLPIIGVIKIPKKKLKKQWYLYTLLCVFLYASFMSYSYTNYIIDTHVSQSYNIGTLGDKKVTTIAGSTAEKFLLEFDIPNIAYKTIDEMYTATVSGKYDVVVHDYPVLLYKSKQDPRYTVVGDIFKKEKYGILYPKGSLLKEEINIALLELQSEGIYDIIYSNYFGDE